MNRKTLVKVGSWLLIILIAPFALEIVLVAEIIGVDVAVAMLVLYLNALRDAVLHRIDTTIGTILAALRAPADRLRFLTRSYALNVAATGVIVWITGSLLVSLMVWLPTLVVAAQYV